jgi:ABC-type transport system involved in Fe-S cluster assembly fused permease/ATPase subunit
MAQRGRHEDLLRARGPYANLYANLFGGAR